VAKARSGFKNPKLSEPFIIAVAKPRTSLIDDNAPPQHGAFGLGKFPSPLWRQSRWGFLETLSDLFAWCLRHSLTPL
jgi:hypothetical protein